MAEPLAGGRLASLGLRRWLAGLVAAVCLGAYGCGGTAASAPDPAPARPAERIFYLGRIPFRTATEVVRGNAGPLERLAQSMGYDRAVMVLAPSYEGVLDLLLAGKVDAAWFGTEAYRAARERGQPVEALAVPVRGGRTWYEGVVITRIDSGVFSLGDLKGKRFAFVDPRSSSGYAAPKRMLEKAGVKVPGDLLTRVEGEPDFLGKHDNVVHAVYFGKAEAGGVYDRAVLDTLGAEPSKRTELTVLARSGRIPNEPVVVRSDTPAETKRKILSAFLALEIRDEERETMANTERFLPYSDLPEGPAGPTSAAGGP